MQPASLVATISSPAAGATVAGTQPVGMTLTHARGTSNTFTLTLDGVQLFTTTISGTTASFDWNTTTVGDGLHTLSLTGLDATGATDTATRTITVNNGGTPLNDINVAFPTLSPGQTVGGVTTVRISTDNTAGANNRFAISVDGVAQDLIATGATSVDWPWNTAAFANGSHTISVTVTDATGRRGIGSDYVTVQNSLVVAITSPASGATVSGTGFVDVWVDGQSGTANAFTLIVAGRIVASQTISGRHATLAWNTTQVPDGPQTILATVVDAANNGGHDSRPVTVQNGSAPPPLAASFTSPAAGATVAGTVTVGLAASGGTAPYTYRLSVDGAQVFSTTTTSATSATFAWNTTTVANGSHALGLTVTDSASGSASATRGVTVQNTSTPPPLAASFTTPAAGATVASTVTVGLAASGGTAPYTYRLSVDGAQVFSTTTTATSASFAWNTTTVANGSHALGLTVTDSASGSASATRGVTVSNTSTGTLRIALTTPTPGSTVSGTVWVNIWVDGATAGSNAYTMTVGSSTVWSQSSTDTHVALPWVTTNTPNGPQTLVAAVRDASGNTGSGSVSVTVQNGSAPPPLAASFTSPAAGATVASTVTVGLAASGGTAPYTYRLTVDGAQVFSTTTAAASASFAWNTTTVTNGSHTLGLAVSDSQSGSASASRSVTVQNTSTPPLTASFTSPAAGATVAGPVTVGLAASGGTAPYTYRLSVDGTQVFSTTTAAASASFAWNTTTVTNGSHALGLTVTDSQSWLRVGVAQRDRAEHLDAAARRIVHQPGRRRHRRQHRHRRSRRQRRHRALHLSPQRRRCAGLLDDHDRHVRVVRLEYDDRRQRQPHAGAHRHRFPERLRVGVAQRDRAEHLDAAAHRIVHQPGRRRHRRRHCQHRPRRQRRQGALHLSSQHRRRSGLLEHHQREDQVVRVEDEEHRQRDSHPDAHRHRFPEPLRVGLAQRDRAERLDVGATATRRVVHQPPRRRHRRQHRDRRPRRQRRHRALHLSSQRRRRAGLLDDHQCDDRVVRLEHHDRRQWRPRARPHHHRLGRGSGSATRSVTVSNASAAPLHVTLTTPTPGATVSGTVWVNIWVDGAAAGSKAYTMTVGGSTVWSQSSTDVPAALPWVTTNTPNGQRTLVVTVRDSANATGTASVSVTVSNP